MGFKFIYYPQLPRIFKLRRNSNISAKKGISLENLEESDTKISEKDIPSTQVTQNFHRSDKGLPRMSSQSQIINAQGNFSPRVRVRKYNKL